MRNARKVDDAGKSKAKRKQGKQASGLPWLWIGVGGVAILGCAGVAVLGAVFFFSRGGQPGEPIAKNDKAVTDQKVAKDASGGKDQNPAKDQKVSKDKKTSEEPAGTGKLGRNVVYRLYGAMPRSRMEAVVGPGKATSIAQMLPTLNQVELVLKVKLGDDVQRVSGGYDINWYTWTDGQNHLFCGFSKGADRLSYADWLGPTPIGKWERHLIVGHISDAETLKAAERVDKTYAMLDDPKWLRGPTVRTQIIGKWSVKGADDLEFTADGNLISGTSNPGSTVRRTYKFLDDDMLLELGPYKQALNYPAACALVRTDGKTLQLFRIANHVLGPPVYLHARAGPGPK